LNNVSGREGHINIHNAAGVTLVESVPVVYIFYFAIKCSMLNLTLNRTDILSHNNSSRSQSMSSFYASKQLHSMRKQLKDLEQQYQNGKESNTERNTVIKSTQASHFGVENEVSYFCKPFNYHFIDKIVQAELLHILRYRCKMQRFVQYIYKHFQYV
jgi:hypothetical protein